MGNYKRLGRLACIALAVSVSETSLAQNAQQCACLLPDAGVGVSLGELVAVEGDVLMSQPAGYSPALQGTSVVAGARILVGASSSASVVFGGSCPLEASAGTIVRVDPTPAGICVSVARPVAEEPVVQAAEPEASGSSNGLLGAALAIAAVGSGVAVIVSSGDDDGVSD